MKVLIIEKETGRLVDEVQLSLSGLNYTPSKEEFFRGAWKIAVDDKIVKAEDRDKYDFKLTQ